MQDVIAVWAMTQMPKITVNTHCYTLLHITTYSTIIEPSMINKCGSNLIYETFTGKKVLYVLTITSILGRLPVIRAREMGIILSGYCSGCRNGAHCYNHHYMAFAKTQKRIRNGVLSVYFKIGLKVSSFKELPEFRFLPNVTFLPELRTARNRTRVYEVTSNHLDQ